MDNDTLRAIIIGVSSFISGFVGGAVAVGVFAGLSAIQMLERCAK